MTTIAYLNGAFQPLEDYRIHPLDRGFLYGDGVYEVMPVYDTRVFCFDRHMQRLARSLAQAGIRNPHTNEQWRRLADELIARSAMRNFALYLQVTRGSGATRDHIPPAGIEPTVFMMPMEPPAQARLQTGAAAITLEDLRWERCDIKSTNLLANIMLCRQAKEAGADEAILTHGGVVTEGAKSNVFVVKDNAIATPQTGRRVLAGITRAVVIKIAEREKIDCRERAIGKDELFTADEIWLTSSTRRIVPVTRIDRLPVGEGRPGPVWRRFSNRIAKWGE